MENTTLTQKDKELIEKANRLSYVDWSLPLSWSDEAETTEAKEKLVEISVRLYRKEEAAAGLA